VPVHVTSAFPSDTLDAALRPLELAISHVLVAAHTLLAAAGLPPGGGVTWAASIAVLVVVVRSALVPLVVRQVRASQRLATAAPRLREVRERYRGARDADSLTRMRAETRAVYAETGARPLGFLPVLAQAPVLLALFRVLDTASHGVSVGALAGSLAGQFGTATLGGASLAGHLGAGAAASAVVLALTVVIAGSLWLLQRRQVAVNTAPAALEGPTGTALRASVWLLPVTALVSGFAFPIGVLVYVACTNLWSLGQQEVLLRRLPTPGSEAHARKLAREAGR
jgi:YidC/Oxa1 family membrane protein insertase